MPHPTDHDYIISTDGSGASDGIGASAAVVCRVDYVDQDKREVVEKEIYVCGNYGESVQRNELQALIGGVRLAIKSALSRDEEISKLEQLAGEDRVRIIWYTDRMNLACSFLFDQNGDTLMRRSSDRDLWLQWAYFSKHVCVTPVCLPRNEEANQALCDEICGITRNKMKEVVEQIKGITDLIDFGKKSQTAIK